MDGSTLIGLALVGFIAWRERDHALERRALLSGRAGRPLSTASPRQSGGGERVRVISADNDKAFMEARGVTEDED